MPRLLPRSAWTSHVPVRPLTPLLRDNVRGISIHWPGTTGPIGDPGPDRIAARLEGYRRFHAGPPPVGRGWSDIAYNIAVDQAGRVWDLRGAHVQSAANGDRQVNGQYIAVLLLVGPGERPTPAAVDAVQWLRSNLVLFAYPRATDVRGHRDVRPNPTDCPGDIVEGFILSGAFSTHRPPIPKPLPKPPYVLKRYLSVGATGPDVEALQKRLNALLGRDTRVDGDFGPDTRFSVVQVQRHKGLAAGGVVGHDTCTKALGWTWAGPK